jgi:hypothetical protein
MPASSTRIRNLPHYRIGAPELAKWIENQGDESWWSVDGDPLLTQRLDFPCPGADIATELRRLGNPLLLFDARREPTATGESISPDQVSDVAFTDHDGNRVLQLCWAQGPDVDWLLVEDTETSESSFGVDDDEER